MTPSPHPPASALPLSPQELAVIDTLRTTPYGSVEVVLHQSKIVQVVKTEKVRLEDPPPAGPPARR